MNRCWTYSPHSTTLYDSIINNSCLNYFFPYCSMCHNLNVLTDFRYSQRELAPPLSRLSYDVCSQLCTRDSSYHHFDSRQFTTISTHCKRKGIDASSPTMCVHNCELNSELLSNQFPLPSVAFRLNSSTITDVGENESLLNLFTTLYDTLWFNNK
jgi:hypothetical protein